MDNIILTNNQIEEISKILGDLLTGTEISTKLNLIKVTDTSGQSTKWRRIYGTFLYRTQIDKSSNSFLRFIQISLSPESYVNNPEIFESSRTKINRLLAFSGIEYTQQGRFFSITKATTIGEARQRTNSLVAKLTDRNVNPSILKYCKEELLNENYFHAVFEATKGLADFVRNLSGLSGDGAILFDMAFSIENPILAINTLTTDAEKNQQKGLSMMLKGLFCMIRNVTAHTPKIKWIIEEAEAIKMLMTISYMQDYLDNCIVVPKP